MSSRATRAPPSRSAWPIARPIPDAPPVTSARSPSTVMRCPRSARSRLPHHLPLPTQTVDLELDDVAAPQVGLVGTAEGHSGGRARVDDVARTQHEELGEVPDEMADPEDHVLGVAVLPQVTVDPEPQAERLRIGHLVRRQDPRAERVE